MSRPSERQLNDHLRRAVSSIPSGHAEELWNAPVEKVDGDAWFLEGAMPKAKSTRHYVRWAGLVAACFAVILAAWFQMFRFTDTTVFLDVNPSVTLDVNRLGKVISTEADNEDGRIILDNMDLRYTDIDVAMNALLGSMVKHGYLSQMQNVLLISVNGRNEARAEALRQRLSAKAEQTLATLLGNGIVLGQTVDLDDAAEDIAEHYGITPGKAVFIMRLLNDQPSWKVQDLTAMPMADLIRYCQAAGIDISQYLGEDGEIIGDIGSLPDDDDDQQDSDHHDDIKNDLKKPGSEDGHAGELALDDEDDSHAYGQGENESDDLRSEIEDHEPYDMDEEDKKENNDIDYDDSDESEPDD